MPLRLDGDDASVQSKVRGRLPLGAVKTNSQAPAEASDRGRKEAFLEFKVE